MLRSVDYDVPTLGHLKNLNLNPKLSKILFELFIRIRLKNRMPSCRYVILGSRSCFGELDGCHVLPSKYTLGSSPIIFTFWETTSMGLAGTWWSQNLYQWVVKRNWLIPQSPSCPAWWYLSTLKTPTPKGWNPLFLGWDNCFGYHLYTTRKHKEPLSYIWAFP
jgi:hypothetical protein